MSKELSRGQRVKPDDILRWGPVWSRRVGAALAHGWWDTTVYGSSFVPQEGRVIVASNHTGIVDGPLLHGVIPRSSHILVKQEFFDSPIGFLMTWAGQIPVDRRAGRAALQVGKALLEEERLVGIFPEGTRGSGNVSKVHAGVAWLATQTGAPIVPAAVLGTRPPGTPKNYISPPRSRLAVLFGPPTHVHIPEGTTGRKAISLAMDQIGSLLADHVAKAVDFTGMPLPVDEPLSPDNTQEETT